jgi:hypothetical protein
MLWVDARMRKIQLRRVWKRSSTTMLFGSNAFEIGSREAGDRRSDATRDNRCGCWPFEELGTFLEALERKFRLHTRLEMGKRCADGKEADMKD